MQFSTILAILASTSVALCVPTAPSYGGSSDSGSDSGSSGESGTGTGNAGNQCASQNMAAACCDGESGISVLGGSCTLTSLLGGETCASGNVQCCQTNSAGFINVDLSCTSLL